MGGIGSGRQNQGGKDITSDMKSLDIRKLQRHGLLLPDMDCTWHWIRNGEKVPSLHIYTDADRMIISYQDFTRGGEWRFMEYTVYLEWTDCNLGGRRAWFHCPVQECGQRVAILYSVQSWHAAAVTSWFMPVSGKAIIMGQFEGQMASGVGLAGNLA